MWWLIAQQRDECHHPGSKPSQGNPQMFWSLMNLWSTAQRPTSDRGPQFRAYFGGLLTAICFGRLLTLQLETRWGHLVFPIVPEPRCHSGGAATIQPSSTSTRAPLNWRRCISQLSSARVSGFGGWRVCGYARKAGPVKVPLWGLQCSDSNVEAPLKKACCAYWSAR